MQLNLRLLRLRQLSRLQRPHQCSRPPRQLSRLPNPARSPTKSLLGHTAGIWQRTVLEANTDSRRRSRNDNAEYQSRGQRNNHVGLSNHPRLDCRDQSASESADGRDMRNLSARCRIDRRIAYQGWQGRQLSRCQHVEGRKLPTSQHREPSPSMRDRARRRHPTRRNSRNEHHECIMGRWKVAFDTRRRYEYNACSEDRSGGSVRSRGSEHRHSPSGSDAAASRQRTGRDRCSLELLNSKPLVPISAWKYRT